MQDSRGWVVRLPSHTRGGHDGCSRKRLPGLCQPALGPSRPLQLGMGIVPVPNAGHEDRTLLLGEHRREVPPKGELDLIARIATGHHRPSMTPFQCPRTSWQHEPMPADRAPSVLITGIHSDHGFAISHRFRKEGWFVIGCDQGTTTGRNARAHISGDLTNEADCRRVAARAAKLGNGIDCIVNCADVHMDGPVEEFGSSAWDVMMDVNVKSVFLLSTACMPYLEELHGAIVAVAPCLDTTAGAEHAVHDA